MTRLDNRNLTFWKRLFPIVFFEIFLCLTVWIFAYGPWPFHIHDGTKLYTFLFLSHFALFLGYLTAAFKRPCIYSGHWNVNRALTIGIMLQLMLLIPTSLFRTGTAIPNFEQGITNPGEVYSSSLQLRSTGNPLVEYTRILAAPFLALFLPLFVFYWRHIKFHQRILGFFALIFILAIYIAMGTNKMIADVVLLSPWLILAGHWSGVSTLERWHKGLIAVACAGAFVCFLAFYSQTMETRSGSFVKHGYFQPSNSRVDEDHFMLRNMPEYARTAIKGLTIYLVHGYYGLYLALNEPFVPCYGVGHSPFLTRQVERLTGNENWNLDTYPARIEKYGWPRNLIWHSIYPWLASDLTFYGTVIFVFIIGRLLALTWIDVLGGKNFLAVAVFAQLVIMLFYFSANNQCLTDGEGIVAFWSLLIWWASTRRHSRNSSKSSHGQSQQGNLLETSRPK